MTTVDDDLLAARFAALAPQPLPADWDDVVGRSGGLARRRRAAAVRVPARSRLLVVFAAVAVLGVITASAFAVRAFVLEKGFIGLPPEGATPSVPQSGRLVLSFWGKLAGHPRGKSHIWVYDDGRIVVLHKPPVEPATAANELSSGLLEQRLTPAGVDVLHDALVATGLFDRNLDLLKPFSPRHGGGGAIEVRRGERLVRLRWENAVGPGATPPEAFQPPFAGTKATPAQVRALERAYALFEAPDLGVPPAGWKERRVRAYVASRYATCYRSLGGGPYGYSGPLVEPSRLLALLPEPFKRVLGSRRFDRSRPLFGTRYACTVVTTDDARRLAGALSAAGLAEQGSGKGRGRESAYTLVYRFESATLATPIAIWFEPYLPHGEAICSGCG